MKSINLQKNTKTTKLLVAMVIKVNSWWFINEAQAGTIIVLIIAEVDTVVAHLRGLMNLKIPISA